VVAVLTKGLLTKMITMKQIEAHRTYIHCVASVQNL
jgi:hypothetical protein